MYITSKRHTFVGFRPDPTVAISAGTSDRQILPAVHCMDRYSLFHMKATWSVHSFNGNYLSIPDGTGSCEYLFHEIPVSKEAGLSWYIDVLFLFKPSQNS